MNLFMLVFIYVFQSIISITLDILYFNIFNLKITVFALTYHYFLY